MRPLPRLTATFSRIWPRRIAIFLPFRPADCSMERQCARPVRRWSICLNGQRHRPAAHNGRVGCQGHKSISRKRSKVARCIERERRRAAVFAVHARSRSSLAPCVSTIVWDSSPGKIRFTLRRVVKQNIGEFWPGSYDTEVCCKVIVTMHVHSESDESSFSRIHQSDGDSLRTLLKCKAL